MRKVAFLLIVMGVIGMAFTAKQFFSRETLDDTQRFSGDHIDHIIIESDHANVNVLPSASEDIEISWKGSVVNKGRRSSDDRVSIDEEKSELRIHTEEFRFFNISFFNLNLFNHLELTIYLPKKQYRTLDITNDIGSTVIKDISVDHLTAENDVANMTVESVQATSMVAKNDVGNITLTNNVGNLHAENDVGNITVSTDGIHDDMTLLSDIGKIKMTVSSIPDDVTFNAYSSIGSVRIFGEKGSYINREAKHIVSLTTEIGNITVDVRK